MWISRIELTAEKSQHILTSLGIPIREDVIRIVIICSTQQHPSMLRIVVVIIVKEESPLGINLIKCALPSHPRTFMLMIDSNADLVNLMFLLNYREHRLREVLSPWRDSRYGDCTTPQCSSSITHVSTLANVSLCVSRVQKLDAMTIFSN